MSSCWSLQNQTKNKNKERLFFVSESKSQVQKHQLTFLRVGNVYLRCRQFKLYVPFHFFFFFKFSRTLSRKVSFLTATRVGKAKRVKRDVLKKSSVEEVGALKEGMKRGEGIKLEIRGWEGGLLSRLKVSKVRSDTLPHDDTIAYTIIYIREFWCHSPLRDRRVSSL